MILFDCLVVQDTAESLGFEIVDNFEDSLHRDFTFMKDTQLHGEDCPDIHFLWFEHLPCVMHIKGGESSRRTHSLSGTIIQFDETSNHDLMRALFAIAEIRCSRKFRR